MRLAFGFAAVAALAWPAQRASAQSLDFLYNDTLLVRPAIPEGFDRGRNQSVLERPRPDYDPLGIPVSSFVLRPRLDVAAGATSNAFLTGSNRKGDGFVTINPTAQLRSDWSRNSLDVDGGVDVDKYFKQGRRDQTSWNLGARSTVELGDSIKIQPEADVARQFESPYAGDTQSTVAVLSSYLTSYFGLRGTLEEGRVRGIVSVDRTSFSFSNVDSDAGPPVSQGYRNRDIARVSAQGEYAFSPSLSAFGQLTYSRIDYSQRLNGLPNRDSDGYRLIAGVNFDLSGFLRGTIGAGYTRRNYDSNLYRAVDGPSVEAQLEYFPTDLTTMTLQLRRILEDSSIGSNNPFFDNRVSLRVDHELLQNLLLNAGVSYGHVSYIGLDLKRDNYQFSLGGRYMATRRYGLSGTMSYGKQTSGDTGLNVRFEEARGELGFYVQI